MATSRPAMLDVELVDVADDLDGWPGARADDGTRGGAVASSATPGTGAARRTGRRRRRLLAGAGAAAVAVLATSLGEAREAARLVALADVPGVVAPMPTPPTPRWSLRESTLSPLRAVGGHLVGSVSTPHAAVEVVALDPATGADLWRTPVGPSTPDVWSTCVVTGPADGPVPATAAPVSVCVVVEETATTEQSALGVVTYPTLVRLVVVDALTGAVVSDVPASPTTHATALGGDVVVDRIGPDGRARVTRTDPRTGREHWSFTTPDPAPTDAFGQRSAFVQAAGDVVVVEADRVWLLAAADGRPLRSWDATGPRDLGAPVQLLPDDLLARTVPDDGGSWSTEVLDLRTDRSFTVPGYPLPARPDDGSLPGLLLLQSADGMELMAYDTRSGQRLWTAPSVSSSSPMVLDGRVLGAAGGWLTALDGRSGEVVWRTDLPAATHDSVVTDGRVLVVSQFGPSGGVLRAFGVEDGRPRWTSRTDGQVFLTPVDGLLFGWTGRGLTAFGP